MREIALPPGTCAARPFHGSSRCTGDDLLDPDSRGTILATAVNGNLFVIRAVCIMTIVAWAGWKRPPAGSRERTRGLLNLARAPDQEVRSVQALSECKVMAFDASLASRVRSVLRGRDAITERKMFGGLAFMVDGKMFIGIRDSSLIARVGAERHDDALAMPSVRVMDFTGRPMGGYVYIDPPAIAADDELKAWVDWCVEYVARLPRKPR